MTTTHASLRLALRLNAGFSIFSALTILASFGALSEVMGVPGWLLIVVALGLLGFAVQLIVTARRDDLAKLRSEALQHSIADFVWVGASAVVIALGVITPTGNQILFAVAVPVLALGIAQYRGLPSSEAVAVSSSP